jgi:NAD(P)-dependent dehydrogenase (short-subunit alcohol dehydrogenase family)
LPAFELTKSHGQFEILAAEPIAGVAWHALDESNEACFAALVDAAGDKFGRIDVLINNATAMPPAAAVRINKTI